MASGVIGSYGRNKSNKSGEFSSGTLCSRASEGGTDYSATKICTAGSRPSFCIWQLFVTQSSSHWHAKLNVRGSHGQGAGEVAPCLQTLGFLSGLSLSLSLSLFGLILLYYTWKVKLWSDRAVQKGISKQSNNLKFLSFVKFLFIYLFIFSVCLAWA